MVASQARLIRHGSRAFYEFPILSRVQLSLVSNVGPRGKAGSKSSRKKTSRFKIIAGRLREVIKSPRDGAYAASLRIVSIAVVSMYLYNIYIYIYSTEIIRYDRIPIRENYSSDILYLTRNNKMIINSNYSPECFSKIIFSDI